MVSGASMSMQGGSVASVIICQKLQAVMMAFRCWHGGVS